ncbi:MAG: hypothetical protein ABFS09_03975 [Thermodesulfobacteriota bacterium]
MAILTSKFLESVLNGAKEHGIKAHILPASKGLLLFAEGIAASEQCSLLKNKAAELHDEQTAPPVSDDQTENCQAPAGQSTIDCQVTVEERAQLFKFLNG